MMVKAFKNHPILSVLLIILFGVAVYFSAYYMIRNSAAFHAAQDVVKSSPYVRSMIGPVKRVSLNMLGGNHAKFIIGGSENSSENISVTARGSFGSINLKLKMEKIDGQWKVTDARSNGQNVDLGQP